MSPGASAPGAARIGFTLIELLVVVAIIGLLISILLPSLSARRTARTAVCASNLHHVGLGCALYADANRGVLVPGRPGRYTSNPALNEYWVGNGYHFRPRWFVRLGAESGFFAFNEPSVNPADDNTKLVDGNAVFLCPEASDRRNNRNYAYGYNYQFLGNTRFRGGQEANGFINFPVRIERVNAGSTVMAADALGTAAGQPESVRTDYRIDGASQVSAVGNHAWSLDPPRLTATSDYCDDNNRAPQYRSSPEARHASAFNVLFVDGHVKRHTYRDLNYVVNPDGSVAAFDPRSSNALFDGTGRDDAPPPIQ